MFCGNIYSMNLKPANQEEQRKKKEARCILGQLPDEIWVEILGKLPFKPLCVCKSVSKTWHSLVSYILSAHKGCEIPPCGLLLTITSYQSEEDQMDYGKLDLSLGYIPLVGDDRTITKWSIDDAIANTASTCITHHTNATSQGSSSSSLLLENLALDFGHLILDRKMFRLRTMHRGLFLVGITNSTMLHVYNPATRQVFVLPGSPNMLDDNIPIVNYCQATIINLSDCLLSTQCDFRVIRFNRDEGIGMAEIYSSNKNQWFQSEFSDLPDLFDSMWMLYNSVYVQSTLFFMTDMRYVVGAKFLTAEHEQVSVYSLPFPECLPEKNTPVLYGSQGCLYLCYDSSSELYIWKHNVRSVDTANAWIPQLMFDRYSTPLCHPVAKRYLSHFVSDLNDPSPMVIHPMEPIVFIFAKPSIFAFHLVNDTVEKIVELADNEDFSMSFVDMYSPCFASLGSVLSQEKKSSSVSY